MRDPGIVVELGGRKEYIRIEFGQILADIDALRMALSLKGANCIKPCLCCLNCVKKGNRSSRPGTRRFDIRHHDMGDFQRCACTDIWANVDRLQAGLGTLNKTRFNKLENATGLNYNPHSLLADRSLREHFKPSEAFRYDPLHIVLADGLAGLEIWAFLSACFSRFGIGFSTIRKYVCAAWKYTSSRSTGNRKSAKTLFHKQTIGSMQGKGRIEVPCERDLGGLPIAPPLRSHRRSPDGTVVRTVSLLVRVVRFHRRLSCCEDGAQEPVGERARKTC